MKQDLNPKASTSNGSAGQHAALEKPVYDPNAPSAIEVDHIVKKVR